MAPSSLRERELRRSRRAAERRRNARPFKPLTPPNYCHISIQPARDESRGRPSLGSANFVIRPSAQDSIAENLAYAKRIASAYSHNDDHPADRPTTFAEAAMSTRAPGIMGGSSKDSKQVHSPMILKPFESLGILKQSKKRKKAQKWSMLDLSAVSEVVGNDEDFEGPAKRVSSVSTDLPLPQAQPSSPDNLSQELGEFEEFVYENRAGETGESSIGVSFLVAAEPTLTQNTADGPSIYYHQPQDGNCLIDPLDNDLNDSAETKQNFESVMAHLHQYISPRPSSSGEETFNSVTWDPDLPQASPSAGHPKTINAPKLKPAIAYTTVGSVVDPNNIPQFSAPNRIQREGAGRRPLMAMNDRHYDNLLQPRGLPLLGMQGSMQYTQHLLQIPPTYDSAALRPSMRAGNQLPPSSLQLTEQEKEVLGSLDETIHNISVDSHQNPSAAPSITSTGSESTQGLRPKIMLNDEEIKRAYGVPGSRQGLEKMQTLQRLARFENPMREHALSRLSEFSVANSNSQVASKSSNGVNSLEDLMRSQLQLAGSSGQGEINHDFRFPPPGLAPSSSLTSTVANPLYGVYGPVASRTLAPLSRPPGYPQPLTAGPPGQRQPNQAFLSARLANSGNYAANFANSATMWSRQSSGLTSFLDSRYQSQGATVGMERRFRSVASSDNKTPATERNPFGEAFSRSQYDPFRPETCSTRLQLLQKAEYPVPDAPSVAPVMAGPHTYLYDTIPSEMMAKYYPNGVPAGKTYYRPVGEDFKFKSSPIEQDKESKRKELADFFYYGQRRYDMTSEEHIIELERRESKSFGPIGPPSNGSVVTKPLTPQGVENMTAAESVKPAIDGLFGTLLSFAEKSDLSRTKLSGWVKGPAHLIDDTPEGNRSCFGEDWGRKIPRT